MTSSSVTTQDAVSEHHGSVTIIMTVETGLMKTAVSDISIVYVKNCSLYTLLTATDQKS